MAPKQRRRLLLHFERVRRAPFTEGLAGLVVGATRIVLLEAEVASLKKQLAEVTAKLDSNAEKGADHA